MQSVHPVMLKVRDLRHQSTHFLVAFLGFEDLEFAVRIAGMQGNLITAHLIWVDSSKSPFCEAFTGFVLGVETAFHSSKLKRAMPESKSAMGNPSLKIQVPQATVFSSPQRIARTSTRTPKPRFARNHACVFRCQMRPTYGNDLL